MRIPISLGECPACTERNSIWIDLQSSQIQFACKNCGHRLDGPIEPGFTVGLRGLARSLHELTETKDYNLSIVFSAMGIEWELVRLFLKWKEINGLRNGKEVSIADIKRVLHKHRKFIELLKKTGMLLRPEGFVRYVKESRRLAAIISAAYPEVNKEDIVKYIERNVFWIRNEIVHQGTYVATRENAEKIYGIARLVVYILNRMDSEAARSGA